MSVPLDTPLFVYGSLLAGQEADGYLGGLERWPARIQGTLYRLAPGYPALVAQRTALPGGPWVLGELVVLDRPGRLQVLDLFEGAGRGLFRRELLQVQVAHRMEQAWAYVMDERQVGRLGGHPLSGGDWRRVSPGRRPRR